MDRQETSYEEIKSSIKTYGDYIVFLQDCIEKPHVPDYLERARQQYVDEWAAFWLKELRLHMKKKG